MRYNAFGQFEGADFENRCYMGILGGHQPHFHSHRTFFSWLPNRNCFQVVTLGVRGTILCVSVIL